MKIERIHEKQNIEKLFKIFPAVSILGPRQCGKTTLARDFGADHFFDLENPTDWQIMENPELNLGILEGTIAIDEIQRKPDLFPILRHLIDTKPKQKYLLLGSASPLLIKQTSDSLAGRIGYHSLGGFNPKHLAQEDLKQLWVRGGFPRAFLADSDDSSFLWRENYIRTFLERDIPQLGIQIPANTIRRFWTMLSHYHSQILNYSEFSRSFGVSDKTVRNYLEILEGTFMVRVLQPWYENIGKRLTKKPKLYFTDSGIYHYFSSLQDWNDVISSPRLGASYEGYVVENIIRISGIPERNFYYWRTHAGSELDLFWQYKGKNYGVEIKYLDAPKTTKSMHSALKDLNLEKLYVIYPGNKSYLLAEKIIVLPFHEVNKELWFVSNV
ncbi:MAG: ATP-binding protein [Leptospiraceae bacterium]|nr:ATP-binding protein [Leptospiraceae bacterium]